MTPKRNHEKYALYEKSVQSPERHVAWFASVYRDLKRKEALHLREDFCGTFGVCCEWARQSDKHRALGLDLDPEPIAYGRKTHFSKLSATQKKHVKVVIQDVLTPTTAKSDLIVACNFSFFIFREREILRKYFKACLKSLDQDGVLLCEMAGGPGMIEQMKETKAVLHKGKRQFTYVWDQKSFDPIQQRAHYSIHFKFPGGETLRDAFTYDWRLWTIPEVREIMHEAGFAKTVVYWETEHEGECTGEYIASEQGDNAYSWIAYVVGVK